MMNKATKLFVIALVFITLGDLANSKPALNVGGQVELNGKKCVCDAKAMAPDCACCEMMCMEQNDCEVVDSKCRPIDKDERFSFKIVEELP